MGERAPPRRLHGNGLKGDSDKDDVIPEGVHHHVVVSDAGEHLPEELKSHGEQLGLLLAQQLDLGE